MAIDYVIDYDCEPKRKLTTEGIIERIKGRERAAMIIRMYREKGDDRPPSEMGFEFTRSTPDGQGETQLIVVQDLLDAADELQPLEQHCRGCPANRTGTPFGCTGFVQYPFSGAGEAWLLDQIERLGLDETAFRSRDYVIAVDEEQNERAGFGRRRHPARFV